MTHGAEIGFSSALGDRVDGAIFSGLMTRDTSVFRSGATSYKCDSAGTNSPAGMAFGSFTPVASRTYSLRAYLNFGSLPGVTTQVFLAGTVAARVTTGGKVQLFNITAGTQIGSDSSATLVTSQWYRFELQIVLNGSTQLSAVELRLDGTTVASTTGLTLNWSAPSVGAGWMQSPGTNLIMYVDDCGANDSTGSDENSWLGDGKIVLLKPISDNARGTGWVGGGGGTSNLFTAVDNTPPVGVADTGTDTSQIRNATSAANSNMDFNLTDYTTAGIGAADTINVVVPLAFTGAPVTTSSKQGTLGVVSNPTIANVALGPNGTAGAFWSGTTAGTFNSGWKGSQGTPTYNPSVTLGTSPVMRMTQVTSSTRIAMVCFMGMYVDYTPGAPAGNPPYRNRMPPLIAQ